MCGALQLFEPLLTKLHVARRIQGMNQESTFAKLIQRSPQCVACCNYEKWGHAVRSNGVSGSASNTTMNLLVNCDCRCLKHLQFSHRRAWWIPAPNHARHLSALLAAPKKTEVTAIAELPHIFPRHGHQVIRHLVPEGHASVPISSIVYVRVPESLCRRHAQPDGGYTHEIGLW